MEQLCQKPENHQFLQNFHMMEQAIMQIWVVNPNTASILMLAATLHLLEREDQFLVAA
jgi:hypothetical protein